MNTDKFTRVHEQMPQWLQKTWKHFVIVTPKVISPPWRFSFIPVSFLFVSERSGIYIFGPIPLKRPSFHGPTVVVRVLKGFHCTLIANSWHVPQSKRKVYTVHWINLYNSCSHFPLVCCNHSCPITRGRILRSRAVEKCLVATNSERKYCKEALSISIHRWEA